MKHVVRTPTPSGPVFRDTNSFDEAMKEACKDPSSPHHSGTIVGTFKDDGTPYGVCGVYCPGKPEIEAGKPEIEDKTEE